MKNILKDQLGELFIQLQDQLTPQQRTVMVNAMATIQHSSDLLYELDKADHIIHNCINAMTENQRFNVGQKNCQQGLVDGWAYRSEPRKQAMAKAKRILGGV